MYSLLVSAFEGNWNSGRATFTRSRIGEYTSPTLRERIDLSNPASREWLKNLPVLFAYEHPVGEPARVGTIQLLRLTSGGDVRLQFEFDDRYPPIPPDRVEALEWELDIDGWELNRTHWAVKDVDLFAVLRDAEIGPSLDLPERTLTADEFPDAIERIEAFESLALSVATGGTVSPAEWKDQREGLVNDPVLSPLLPSFVRTCLDPNQFFRRSQGWGKYADRTSHIRAEFEQTRRRLQVRSSPGVTPVSDALARLDSAFVSEQWKAALDRISTDPEGAITLARSLLESVFIHILEDLQEPHSQTDTLPGLFRTLARALQLAPDQQSDEDFRRLLGGATSIVEATGAIRNRLGDAHGRGRSPAEVEVAHAQLAVNAAGTVAAFVVRAWLGRSR